MVVCKWLKQFASGKTTALGLNVSAHTVEMKMNFDRTFLSLQEVIKQALG